MEADSHNYDHKVIWVKKDGNKIVNDLDVVSEVSSILQEGATLEQLTRQVVQVLDKSCGMMHGCVVFTENGGQSDVLDFQDTGLIVTSDYCQNLMIAAHGQGQALWQTLDIEGLGEAKGVVPKSAILIISPIKFDGKSLGVLAVIKSYPGGEPFASDLTMLKIVADLVGHGKLIYSSENHTRSVSVTDVSTHSHVSGKKVQTQIRGNSKTIRKVFDQIAQVASSSTTSLILGESGVGKELVADAIHQNSPRAGRPFVKLNCAALPESLLESEIFGHEKGSFTGALNQKKGRFEIADGGTLFLDEIGDISLSTQVKLLRFLQEKEFERIGGVETITSDVRVIAATNRNLEEMIDNGMFRLDLYYRLNVFPIHVPSLRERKPDIIPISDYFIEKYAKELGKDIRRISTPAIDLLVSYHWPGNVRELENCIERAVLITDEDVIQSHHLPPSLQTTEARVRHEESLAATLDSVERELIADALRGAKGNMAKASRKLGLTERVMGLRTKKYQIDPKKFK